MRIRATLAAASLAVGVLALGAPTASASEATTADSPTLKAGCRQHWKLRIDDDNDAGEACYFHRRHRAHVDDQEGNGQSVVLVISKKGGGNTQCWDHTGHEGSGSNCTITKWGNGVHVRGRLCPGEYGHRKIHWKQCTKFKKFTM